MKKKIAKALALLLLLSSMIVSSPVALQADVAVVAAASETVQTPAAGTTATTINNAGKVYVIVSGDVMWKIAQKNNLTLKQLLELNTQITNPNLIYVGQKIAVGSSSSATAVSAADGSVKIYQGSGQTVTFRNGPGKDSTGVPVYSFNIAMARATFDADGRILSVYIDGYEVATPNYDGASMPHFSGWPDKEGYNVTDHGTGNVTGVQL